MSPVALGSIGPFISAIDLPILPVDPNAAANAANGLSNASRGVTGDFDSVEAAWMGIRYVYDTPDAESFVSRVGHLRAAVTGVENAYAGASSALDTYASELSAIKQRISDLRRRIAEFEVGIADARASATPDPTGAASMMVSDHAATGLSSINAQLFAERDDIVRRIDAAASDTVSELGRIQGVPGFDHLAGTAPSSPPVGAFGELNRAAEYSVQEAILTTLATMSEDEIAATLAAHPEWQALLDTHPPKPAWVASWWASITDPAVQAALVAGAPLIIGSLDGLPPMVRVEANRGTAQTELASTTEQLAALEAEQPSEPPWIDRPAAVTFEESQVNDADDRAYREREAEIALLRQKQQYLQDAIDGAVQLYLYRPDRDAIIEMVGTPSAQTTATGVYIPGTFTNMDSFYSGDAQQMAHLMVDASSGKIVIFVWQNSDFAGEYQDNSTALGMATGIGAEAAQQSYAYAAGGPLAQFQEGYLLDEHLNGTFQVGMGHSWGMAALAASEIAGAHYDQVHSFAGAYLPDGWSPDPNTSYYHWSYDDDILMFAQDVNQVSEAVSASPLTPAVTPVNPALWPAAPLLFNYGGLIGSGDFPRLDEAFQTTVYENQWGLGGVEAHNMIVSNRSENDAAFLDVWEVVDARR